MIKLFIIGITGAMGGHVAKLASENTNFQVVGGLGHGICDNDFPVYEAFDHVNTESFDCIIDFSNAALTESLLAFAANRKCPLVLCTTGLSPQTQQHVLNHSRNLPVFQSGNMSLGINLVRHLLESAAQVLGYDADIEIIEKHHNRKLDAPSGTAIMLAESVNSGLDKERDLQLGREVRGAKDRSIINVHSVRGGNIIGEHEVIFAIDDEIISISHTAYSRKVFAKGALDAAAFLVNQPPGLYTMDDLLKRKPL